MHSSFVGNSVLSSVLPVPVRSIRLVKGTV